MKHIPTVIFAVLALLAWVLVSRFNPKEVGAQTPSTLTPMETKGVDLVTEMNKLIVAIATLILAGVGKLVTSERKDGKRVISLSALVRTLLGATVVLAFVTLYYSYVIYDKLVEMIAGGFMNLNSTLILSTREWQVDSLFAALFGFGLAVMIGLTDEP
jgi:hypothetical protein